MGPPEHSWATGGPSEAARGEGGRVAVVASNGSSTFSCLLSIWGRTSACGFSWNLADHPKLPKMVDRNRRGFRWMVRCVFFPDCVGKNERLGVFLKTGGHRVFRRRGSAAAVVIDGSISGR